MIVGMREPTVECNQETQVLMKEQLPNIGREISK